MKKLIFTLAMVIGVMSSSVYAGDSAENIIAKNNCMSCHNIMGMKAAPPFAGIAYRNTRWGSNAKESIMNSIKNGSSGKYPMFANTKMPSFSNLTQNELSTVADWILSQASNMGTMGRCGMGKCGSGMMNNNSRY